MTDIRQTLIESKPAKQLTFGPKAINPSHFFEIIKKPHLILNSRAANLTYQATLTPSCPTPTNYLNVSEINVTQSPLRSSRRAREKHRGSLCLAETVDPSAILWPVHNPLFRPHLLRFFIRIISINIESRIGAQTDETYTTHLFRMAETA